MTNQATLEDFLPYDIVNESEPLTEDVPKDFDPAEYHLEGWYYLARSEEAQEYADELHRELSEDVLDFVFARMEEFGWGTTCDYCGTRHSYGAAFLHTPSGKYVAIGNNCAGNHFNYSSRDARERDKLRKKAARLREKLKIEKKCNEYLNEYPQLVIALNCDHRIVADIKSRFRKYGSMSDKQRELVMKLYHEEKEKKARWEKRKKESGPTPEGRVEMSGKVVSIKTKETQWGSTEKMLVELENGSRVYGTVPTAICHIEKGAQISFRATVTQSKDDHTFGFFKRPSNAVDHGVDDE